MGNTLILFGIILIIVGVVLNLISKFGFPLLPGDILIQKENWVFYFPIITAILISIILTLLFNIFKK